MSILGKRLKLLRKANELTQIELAKSLGLAFSTISMYERGERMPDFETMEAIADYFNVTMDYLYGKTDIPNEAATIIKDENGQQQSKSKPFTDETLYEMFYNSFANGCPYTMDKIRKICTPYSVTDNSMFPSYRDGDKVLILITSQLEHNGEIALISYKDAVSLKRVEYNEDDNSYVLSHINPDIPPIIVKGDNLACFKILGIPTLMIRQMPIE